MPANPKRDDLELSIDLLYEEKRKLKTQIHRINLRIGKLRKDLSNLEEPEKVKPYRVNPL